MQIGTKSQTNWDKLVQSAGWHRLDEFSFPIYSKIIDTALVMASKPDTSNGLVPVIINASERQQYEIHEYLSSYSQNIIIGDIDNAWKHKSYSVVDKVQYQVIDPKTCVIEKEALGKVRQSQKYGVVVEEMNSIREYLDCVKDTAERHKKDMIHPWYLERMLHYGGGLEAKYKGKTIAGCLYIEDDGILRFCNSASITETMTLGPNNAIMSALIDVAGTREIFLGNAPSFLAGLYSFKKSFGAITREFTIKRWNPKLP